MKTIVIDFETTGLVKDGVTDFLAQPGIVQIGALAINELGGKSQEFNMLINPEMTKWEEGAMKVHGITPEKVANAPTFFEVFRELSNLFIGAQVWAGFNTKFDKDVLWFQLLRYGFERSFPWPPDDVDVMKIAVDRLNIMGRGGKKRMKLVDAYREVFGKDYGGAHDAMTDVHATADLLLHWGHP